jgi:uncharacterized protein (DUF433 family)
MSLPDRFTAPYYAAMNYQDIITIEPAQRGGKPCIREMRIAVYDVLEYLAAGSASRRFSLSFPTSPCKISSPVWLTPPIAKKVLS